MSERPSLGNYEVLKVVPLDSGASKAMEDLTGQSEDPTQWELIDFAASDGRGFLLIGKRRMMGKAQVDRVRI